MPDGDGAHLEHESAKIYQTRSEQTTLLLGEGAIAIAHALFGTTDVLRGSQVVTCVFEVRRALLNILIGFGRRPKVLYQSL